MFGVIRYAGLPQAMRWLGLASSRQVLTIEMEQTRVAAALLTHKPWGPAGMPRSLLAQI